MTDFYDNFKVVIKNDYNLKEKRRYNNTPKILEVHEYMKTFV